MDVHMTKRGKVDKRYGAKYGDRYAGGHRRSVLWTAERMARYRKDHPIVPRSYDDWGFTAGDERKFVMMLHALQEDVKKRVQEAEARLLALGTERQRLQDKIAELESQLKLVSSDR